ncbi:MAG: FG-GAP repeat domain-containing protein, partial [Actinomycetota bacterium]
VYVWDANGRRRKGWPKVMDVGVRKPRIPRQDIPFGRPALVGAIAPPVLFDMDGDDRLEVIEAGGDGHLHVWRRDGRRLPGWPVKVQLPSGYQPPPGHFIIQDEKLITPPAVADLDGDGKPELVVRSQYTDVTGAGITPLPVSHLHTYHADGRPVAGWPADMPGIAEYYGSGQDAITEGSNAPVAANVDGLPGDEVASAPVFSQSYLLGGDASIRVVYGPQPDLTMGLGAGFDPVTSLTQPAVPADVPISFTTSGAFGRFGGRLIYAEPGSGGASIIAALLQPGSGFQLKNYLRAFDGLSGVTLPGFPAFQQGLNFLGSPALADVSGDGQAEILDGADSSALHAYSFLGAQAPGFPKFTTGWSVLAPSIADLNGDGRVEVVTMAREGYLFAWRTPGLASANAEWWRNRHDEWNTANYGTDARPPGAPLDVEWNPETGVVRFVAAGDDWGVGQVEAYRVRVGPRWLVVRATVSGGEVQRLSLPPGASAIQALDEAGNVGPVVPLP